MQPRTRAVVVVLVLVLVPAVYVVEQAVRTLRILSVIERERDTWQRPDDIIQALDLKSGDTVVDLGCGAGYFALKMARDVGGTGRVLAVDLRRQSLAFLWMRATRRGDWNLHVIRGEPGNPRLPPGPVDAVLIANTYHELTSPEPVLQRLFAAMRPGARLVVVDRGPRDESESRETAAVHHELTAAAAERDITRLGFQVVSRNDHFIDRSEDQDVWWLTVFRKPSGRSAASPD